MAIGCDNDDRLQSALERGAAEVGGMERALATAVQRPSWRNAHVFGGDEARVTARERGRPHTHGVLLDRRWGCPLTGHELGDTALHLAARHGAACCVQRLLRLGACATAFNRVAATPLMVARGGCAAVLGDLARWQRPPTPEDRAPTLLGAGGDAAAGAGDPAAPSSAAEALQQLAPPPAIVAHAHPYGERPDRSAAAAVYHYLATADALPRHACHMICGFGSAGTSAGMGAVPEAAAAIGRRVARRCCELFRAGAAASILFCGSAAEAAAFRSTVGEEGSGVPARTADVVQVGGSRPAADEGITEDVPAAAGAEGVLRLVRAAIGRLQRGAAPADARASGADGDAPGGFLAMRCHLLLVAAPTTQRRMWLHMRRWSPPWVVLHNAPPQVLVRERDALVDYSYDAEKQRCAAAAARAASTAAAATSVPAGAGAGAGGSAAHRLETVLVAELQALQRDVDDHRPRGAPDPAAPPSRSAVLLQGAEVLFAARELLRRHFCVVGLDLGAVDHVRDQHSAGELRSLVKRGGDEASGGVPLERAVRALPTKELRLLLQDAKTDSRGMRTVLVPRAVDASTARRQE
eukprot:g2377.t1